MNIDVLPTAWLTMWRSVPIDETLVGHGYDGQKLTWDAFWGMRYAVVHDPDGNGVDLFSPSRAVRPGIRRNASVRIHLSAHAHADVRQSLPV
jgi:hypothetical protein